MMSDAKDICAREGCDVPRFMHDHGYLLDSKWHAFVEPAAKSAPVPRCAQWDNDECTKDEPCDEGAAAEFCDLGESGDGPYCNPGYCYFREPDDASADADVRDILNRHGLPVPSIATTWNTKIVKAVREGYAAGIVAGRADGIDDRLNATLIIVRNEIEQARRGHRQGMPQKDLCYWDGRQTMAEDFERIFMDAIAARRAKA